MLYHIKTSIEVEYDERMGGKEFTDINRTLSNYDRLLTAVRCL